MSLQVKALNADSSFLLTFSPQRCSPLGLDPSYSSYTILLDPWLSGPSKVWLERFALTHHSVPACVDSLADLPEPDLVLISQEKTDHCHEDTLRQLPRKTKARFLGTPGAVRKIRSWKHFDSSVSIEPLRKFDATECRNRNEKDGIVRIPIPPLEAGGSAGELSIGLVSSKMDVTGLHNAIGITYRPPGSAFTSHIGQYVDLPPTPPASPPFQSSSSSSILSSNSTNTSKSNPFSVSNESAQLQRVCSSPQSPQTTVYPPPVGTREQTISVLYSPHGVDFSSAVKPYASTHLVQEGALPLSLLLHSFNRLENPWYMGGTVCAGYPSGIEIAAGLYARAWVGAHDEEKESSGVAVKGLKVERATLNDVRLRLEQYRSGGDGAKGVVKRSNSRSSSSSSGRTPPQDETLLCSLGAGEEYHIAATR